MAVVVLVIIGVVAIVHLVEKKRYDILLSRIKEQASICNRYQNRLFTADSATDFFDAWDSFHTNYEMLLSYQGINKRVDKNIKNNFNRIKAQYDQMETNLQWYLRDAIEKEALTKKTEIRTFLRNSREQKENAYRSFCIDMTTSESKFSEETKDFAKECADMLYKVAGIYTPKIELFSDDETGMNRGTGNILGTDFEDVDSMEGHQFEHWCARLLEDNGFQGVSVTPGSGDQGVDILAEKSGIRYAIQCKCFSNPLGNKPIQEVHTGKEIYHCHVGAVMTNSTFTAGAIEAAKHTNVLLWDRQTLEKMIEKRNTSVKTGRLKCPNCGTVLEGTEKFCLECGKRL